MQKCAYKYPKKAKSGGQTGVGGWYGIPRDYRPFKFHSRGCIMMGKYHSSQKASINSLKKAKMGAGGQAGAGS